MVKRIILGVHTTNRVANVPDVQRVLTEYGCNIKTRLGLHTVNENMCSCSSSSIGLLLIETCGPEEQIIEMEQKLKNIHGTIVEKMVFEE